VALAALADRKLRATTEQLCHALGACAGLTPEYRWLQKMALEQQIGRLDQEMARPLSQRQDAVQRLAEVPGLDVDSSQQVIAEVAPWEPCCRGCNPDVISSRRCIPYEVVIFLS
jgi:hypothetical protein